MPGLQALVGAPASSAQQAEDAARQAVPGATVLDTDLGHDRGATVWEVEVRTPQGVEYEVRIEANNGAVMSVEQGDEGRPRDAGRRQRTLRPIPSSGSSWLRRPAHRPCHLPESTVRVRNSRVSWS
ncbi:PepSY domain-containing protein [Nocardia terpenica]|uniref:PepSY domain-containing protein n=1 Tax=Nocardia terpenica TaxID=455432 RepID=UPI003A5BC408